MTHVNQVDEMQVYWVKVRPDACGTHKNVNGCATMQGNRCVIRMPENADDRLIAHEFRHCFGYEHWDYDIKKGK